MQKWPDSVVGVRHGESVYNVFDRESLPSYHKFVEQFDLEFSTLTPSKVASGLFPSEKLRSLAVAYQREAEEDPTSPLLLSDYDTPLTAWGEFQAEKTGLHLPEVVELPDMVYISPYLRTRQTFEGLKRCWPDLAKVPVKFDERLREQEHGKRSIYADPRIYCVFNPEYALLYKGSTIYEYKHEGGESLLDVRNRTRNFATGMIREHGGVPRTLKDLVLDDIAHRSQRVAHLLGRLGVRRDASPEKLMLVTHHRTILAMRANIERWDRTKFLFEEENNKPPNASVTSYRGIDSGADPSRRSRGGWMQDELVNLTFY
jgi:broad specificity phosphatase PhoE